MSETAQIRTANLIGSVTRNAGGLFESVCRMVQSLARTGMEVKVLGLEDRFTAEDVGAWAPVPVVTSEAAWPAAFGYSPVLAQELEAFAPDITHVHGIWMYLSIACSRYSRRHRRPYLVSPHGMLDPWAIRNSRWKKVVARCLYEQAHLRGAHCLRALCEAEARAMRKFGLRNPIAIIPNGIDLPEVRSADPPALRSFGGAECGVRNQLVNQRVSESVSVQQLPLSGPWHQVVESGRKVLLYLGRIHPKKGLINLVKAWASAMAGRGVSLGARSADWALALAGWDQNGHEPELKSVCDEFNIRWADIRCRALAGASIVFLGPQFGAAKAACYAGCDGFVLPSYSEGLPMAVLEAWAHGKPVLMTPECNLPEGFAAGAALQIKPDAQDILRGLNQLFELSEVDRQRLGDNGRRLVAGRFAWPTIAADMKRLYEWILGGGPTPRSVIDFLPPPRSYACS